MPLPWNNLSPFEASYSTDVSTTTAMPGTDYSFGSVGSGPVVNYVAEDAHRGQTVGYDNVSVNYDPVTEMISVRAGNADDSIVQESTSDAVTDVYFGYSPSGCDLFHNFFTVRRILPIIYIIGFITFAGILGLQKFYYLKRLRGSFLIEHNETINTILRDMDMGHVLVLSSDEIASPMVCGLLNPRIYLPTQMDFTNTLLLQHVLTHETMHIRRKDNLLKCVMVIVLCLNWFNPLVWLMSACLASDLEAACDAAVLGQCGEDAKKDYACSLLAMAISGSRTSLLYSAFSKTEVEKRVKNILSYKKMTFLALFFTILLLAGSMTAFASIGQAPFFTELTAYCASAESRWGVEVTLSRDIALGKDAQDRAENIVFSVLRTDETENPRVIEDRIKEELAKEFGVEKGAFSIMSSLCLSNEDLQEEYKPWGLLLEDGNPYWNYQGETIRTYEDKMLGSYQSTAEGTVDVSVQRDECGKITSVAVWHEGDREYDEHTRRMEQSKWSYSP